MKTLLPPNNFQYLLNIFIKYHLKYIEMGLLLEGKNVPYNLKLVSHSPFDTYYK